MSWEYDLRFLRSGCNSVPRAIRRATIKHHGIRRLAFFGSANFYQNRDCYRQSSWLRLNLNELLNHFDVVTVPFGELHAEEARRAYQKYGKGRHPAALNFGDCMSYATASLAREPLLCVGNDFSKTDLEIAPY